MASQDGAIRWLRQEQRRITAITRIAIKGIHVGDPSLLSAFFFEDGVLRAFQVLNLGDAPHSITPQEAWDWCARECPNDTERLYAGLGFLGSSCEVDAFCSSCRFYRLCPSHFDPCNRAEECGEAW